jgi:hypothetical protein
MKCDRAKQQQSRPHPQHDPSLRRRESPREKRIPGVGRRDEWQVRLHVALLKMIESGASVMPQRDVSMPDHGRSGQEGLSK